MAEDVKFEILGNSEKALAALTKIVAGQDKMIGKFSEIARASKDSSKTAEEGMGKAADKVINFGMALQLARKGAEFAKQAFAAWRQEIDATAQAASALSDSYRTVAIMKGEQWPGFKAALGPIAATYGGVGGAGAGYRAAETVVSLMPSQFFSQQQQLATAQQVLRFSEAYGIDPNAAAGMMGKGMAMFPKAGLSATQWSNMLAGVIERGGYAGPQLQEWAGAMPTLFGGMTTAGVSPAKGLALGELFSTITGSPGEGMSGAEQVLRKISLPGATKGLPALRGTTDAIERLSILADMWKTGKLSTGQIEKAFGERGMRYIPRVLEAWDTYAPRLAEVEAGMVSPVDTVEASLSRFRAQDVPGRLAYGRAVAGNVAAQGRLADVRGQQIATVRDVADAVALQSGQSAIGRWLSRSLYDIGTFFGQDPINAMEAAYSPAGMRSSAGEREAWTTLRSHLERLIGTQERTAKALEGTASYAPEEPIR